MTRDIVCFSHLRWDFVYQRPNHLMARAASSRRVFYVEEPVLEDATEAPSKHARLDVRIAAGVRVVTPILPAGTDPADVTAMLEALLDDLLAREHIERPVLWYYTPMALSWTRHVAASARVYDCMDFLAGFRGAPAGLLALEEELVHHADVVFTGGARLHERMADRHGRAYCFPSSVDSPHFRAARKGMAEPGRMAGLRRPRIGYAGVIDERVDLELVAGVALARPDWQIVLVGPHAKISPDAIPTAPNVHVTGLVDYADLPAYLGSWDIGWMPFAHNEATRYISPTKTPEYLAAGLRVISTSIRDVVEPYGRRGLVEIADDVSATIAAAERLLAEDHTAHLARADAFLATMSWDRTWAGMEAILAQVDRRVRPEVLVDAGLPRRVDRRPAARHVAERTATAPAGETA